MIRSGSRPFAKTAVRIASRQYSQQAPGTPKRSRSLAKVGFMTTGALAITAGLVYQVSGGATFSRSAPVSSSLPLSPTHFTPTTVESSEDAGGPTKLIKLKLPPQLIPKIDEYGRDPLAPVFSIYIKDSDIQVERPYTPLQGISEDGQMSFWVKRYQRGEVGRWFNSRKVGEVVEIRGPVPTFAWRDGEYDEIILISGGTGITPFYRLLYDVFGSGKHSAPISTHFTLLHASPSIETLPPPHILNDISLYAQNHPENLSVKLFTTQTPSKQPSTVQNGRIGRDAIETTRQERGLVRIPSWRDWMPFTNKAEEKQKSVLFVVCGPESMITDITGPRVGRPRSDGLVGGVLGELGYKLAQVKRL